LPTSPTHGSTAVTAVSAAPPSPASAPPTSGRSHDQARRTAALGVRFEREIKTALVAGPKSALDIAKACHTKHKDIKQSLKRLFAAGTIRKIGARGPAVKWELAGVQRQAPRRAAAVRGIRRATSKPSSRNQVIRKPRRVKRSRAHGREERSCARELSALEVAALRPAELFALSPSGRAEFRIQRQLKNYNSGNRLGTGRRNTSR
jgi:hypothetical protein